MPIRLAHTIEKFAVEQWRPLECDSFPFTDFEFLLALEKSNCVGPHCGWEPVYFYYRDAQDQLLAVWIFYLKMHSYGEYIFDHEWAHAYQSQGESYYPKLLSAIPFTPATGSKFLHHPNADLGKNIYKDFDDAIANFSRSNNCSSTHHLFIEPDTQKFFLQDGYRIRKTFQFHWHNKNYSDFSDFLHHFVGKKRKNILKERREIQNVVSINHFTDHQLTEDHARLMFRFYRQTIQKMGGYAYLNEDFFVQVFQTMQDRILLTLASTSEGPVAGSICFYKGPHLYGRYWGTFAEIKHLHFELCYYQPLEYAIRHKMRLFEAGAQGGHKWQRGFLPVATYSAHRFESPKFQNAIEQFLRKESEYMTAELALAEAQSPFKQVPN